MARVAYSGKLSADRIQAYIAAHGNLGPEMEAMIRDSGARNFSIYLLGDRVFGYYECDDPEAAIAYMDASEVGHRWGDALGPVWDEDANGHGIDYMVEVCRVE